MFQSAQVYCITNLNLPKHNFFPIPEQVPGQQPEPQPQPTTEKPGKDESKTGSTNQITVRRDFRETFLWTDLVIDSFKEKNNQGFIGERSISANVTELVTTYSIRAVAMSKYNGIGLSNPHSNITIFMKFFISLEPPFTVKRDEIVTQDINIFNYVDQDQSVEISIHKRDGFEMININDGWSGELINHINFILFILKIIFNILLLDSEDAYTKTITTTANTNVQLTFDFKATKLGILLIKVTAKGSLAGDAIEKSVKVIPEGVPKSITDTVLIYINKDKPTFPTTDLSCKYPDGTYADTKDVSATVIGDNLGKALTNLDRLINLPSGCGEQTLIFLVPNMAVRRYLSATNQLTPEIDAKIIQYTQSGYQNQLNYKRSDGGFSAFGEQDPQSSTWLTCYTSVTFAIISSFITVDSNVITGGLNFVISKQNAEGAFIESGRVIHKDMQGNSGDGIAMTAFIADGFNLIKPLYPIVSDSLTKALNYLAGKIESTNDVYELATIALALQRANHPDRDLAWDKFYPLAITNDPRYFYWEKTVTPPGWYGAISLNIETTAYGLQTMLMRTGVSEDIKLRCAKYIISKANEFGGYSSSFDTVMGLFALADFAIYVSVNGPNLALTLDPNVGNTISATVNSENLLTLQRFDLDDSANKLTVSATSSSTGLAIVSLICNFYQDPSKIIPSFKLFSNFTEACRTRMVLKVCASHIPAARSNMATMTVTMPSGFLYQSWYPPNNPEVSKVEVNDNGASVTFYFNFIPNGDYSCVDVPAFRSKFVAELKGGTITVNDYYDTCKSN
jgi:CD109 antigen